MRDWPPCPPIQRDSGRRSRPGVNPFISALTVARCPATFPGVWPQLRDTLSTSWSVGRGTGAFIYALSADESRPALAAPRHASTALFSCRFKCPCPPRRQRHFHGNAGRAYNTLHFASQSRVPNGGVAPFGNPHKKRRYATPPRGAYRLFCCPGFPKGCPLWHTTLLAKCSVLYLLAWLTEETGCGASCTPFAPAGKQAEFLRMGMSKKSACFQRTAAGI